jgi:hypothetical protein
MLVRLLLGGFGESSLAIEEGLHCAENHNPIDFSAGGRGTPEERRTRRRFENAFALAAD